MGSHYSQMSVNMEFIVKKTTELTEEEKIQILDLFDEVFGKKRTRTEFDNQYLNNPLGYSFHSLMKNEGVIVGHNSGIPCYYLIRGERQLFVCNVDTMIKKHCRGIDNFYDMMINATNRYINEGATVLYGFPNDNSYPILKSLDLMEDIGKLDIYCLPYRIGGIKGVLRPLNLVSKMFCRLWVMITSILATDNRSSFVIEKEDESYNKTRYKRGDSHYSIVKMDSFSFVYKIMTYENIRTAFLIDVIGKSSLNFNKAIRYLLTHEKNNFDLILYVGYLSFNGHGLIKVPHKFEPKHFNFTCKPLVEGIYKDLIHDIRNWDVNLSNYDLI